MKKIYTSLLMLICTTAIGQTLSPKVTATAGGRATGGGVSMSYTIGETFNTKLSANTIQLTQGQQQPELDLRLGTTQVTSCAGSSVSVPFTADGYVDASNVFSVELSDANGSFANPVVIGSLTSMESGSIDARIPAAASGSGYKARVVSSNPSRISSDLVFITVNDLPTAGITNNTGETILTKKQTSISVTATGGTSYAWDNGLGNEATVSITARGTYTVTVYGSNGCSATASIEITTLLDATGEVTDISCFNQTDGSIDLTVFDGTPPYSFKWSNRLTSEDISSLSAGTYSVTITDAVSAKISLSFTVTNPPLLTLNTTQTDLIYCNPEQKGSITPSATGGTGAYSFSIDTGASLTNGVFTNLEAGTYTITVTDENQCSQVKTVTIAASSEINFQAEKSDVTSCTSNGSIRITATGGSSPYSYSIDGGATWQSANSFSNLSQGAYSLQVKDANECVLSSFPVQITDNGSDIYEDNNILGTASAISLELPYQARLGSQGDIDWFRYVNPKGRKNTRTHYLNFAKQDGQIAELYDQAGVLVLPNAGSIPGSPAAYNLLSGRSYYIKVSGASSLSCYTVSLSTSLNTVAAFRILENQSGETQTSENQDTPGKVGGEDVYDVIAYPNPSDGLFRLALPGFADGAARMRITDGMGRMIQDELGQVENGKKLGEVDLTYVAKGVYYVQVMQEGRAKTIRVILK